MTSRGAIRPLAVFLVWMLASFLCHKLAKLALGVYVTDMTSHSSVLGALIVTLFQVFTCYATVNLTSTNTPHFYVIVTSHFLATLATNSSLALTFASSTMAIKMLEPMTSAVLQAVMLGGVMPLESVAGMAVVVMGAILYVGNPVEDIDMAKAVAMAFVSNLALGVRNVAMKLAHNSDSQRSQQLAPFARILAYVGSTVVFLCVTHFSETYFILSANATYFIFLSSASGVFHVTYSYVSTNVVLRYMSVVGHALANIFKRVLVVLLLHVSGRRSASQWNWAGLFLCTVGLVLYNRKKLASSSVVSSFHSLSTSPEQSGNDSGKGTDAQDFSASPGFKQTLLGRLLVALVITYVFCVTPGNMTSPVMTYRHHKQQLAHSVPSPPERRKYLVSKIWSSNPRHPSRSKSDYAQNLRFGFEPWTDGQILLKDPIPFQPERKSLAEVEEFLSREHLIRTPFDTDGLSPYLNSTRAVIKEAKRVHENLFRDIFRGKKYAVLFEFASFENKGDAALSVAEVVMLENMGIKLVFYVNLRKCHVRFKHVEHAIAVAGRYPKDQVVILMHSGGNIFAKSNVDKCRQRTMSLAKGYQQVIMANSIWLRGTREKFSFSLNLYRSRPNLTILIRDRLSLHIAQKFFNGTRLVLTPDMAFQNGPVQRYASPYYDIIWQKRVDHENAIFKKVPAFPSDVKVFVWDWMNMISIQSNSSLEMAVNVMQNGFGILQKGRVLVTDRLHGHILSTLLDIPHVLLDNADQKLSAYHNTWTRGINNCRLADNEVDAARMALELLEEYKDTLPKRLTAVDINENAVG